jgi:hypothetical protein
MTKIVLNTTLAAGTLITVIDAGLAFGLDATPALVLAGAATLFITAIVGLSEVESDGTSR